jgi:nicotinate phosphoribosyltransferase
VNRLQTLYRPTLSLLTDLYQLTMAQGYWKLGMHQRRAAFNLFFRKLPFDGGFAIACGLQDAIEYLQQFHVTREDAEYLSSLQGNDGGPIFDPEFLEDLQSIRFSCDVDAAREGSLVFGNEPMLRILGPIWQCQLFETALLTLFNFPTLVATKAARIVLAAQGQPVIEFGLRRAQGIDGGMTASRAAYIGGCESTSNVLAGQIFGIPIKGTHAHSWVMSFPSELESFSAYAAAMPNNCVFLVDTYNTLEGVRNAARVGLELRRHGHQMIGIRLDSGDLAYLSIEARKILNDAGLSDAKILASNDLDEHIIASLKQQGAQIDLWGVGTRLVTGNDQPALGGVYKLSAIRDSDDQNWEYKLKVSEQVAKISIPGLLQVRRYSRGGLLAADAIYDEALGIPADPTIVDPGDVTRRKHVPADSTHEDLLVPIFRQGKLAYLPPSLADIRQHAASQLSMLHPTIKRFVNPHEYPVGLEQHLSDLRTKLIAEARGVDPRTLVGL